MNGDAANRDEVLFTRAEVVRRLGVSESTTRRLERDGTLASRIDPETGAHLFHPADVQAAAEAVASRGRFVTDEAGANPGCPRKATVAAEGLVFGDLDAGKALTQIVQDRHVSPQRVRALYSEWLSLREVDIGAPVMPEALSAALQQVTAVSARLEEVSTILGQWIAYLRREPWQGAPERCSSCGEVHRFQSLARCPSCLGQFWVGGSRS